MAIALSAVDRREPSAAPDIDCSIRLEQHRQCVDMAVACGIVQWRRCTIVLAVDPRHLASQAGPLLCRSGSQAGPLLRRSGPFSEARWSGVRPPSNPLSC